MYNNQFNLFSNNYITTDINGAHHYICDWQSDNEKMNRKYDYKVSMSLETMVEYLNNEQSRDLLAAICYMQDKYSFFMSDKNYKNFKRFIESENDSCKDYEQDYERIIKNIFKRFKFLCRPESIPFAMSLAMNAQDAKVNDLMCICDLRAICKMC